MYAAVLLSFDLFMEQRKLTVYFFSVVDDMARRLDELETSLNSSVHEDAAAKS